MTSRFLSFVALSGMLVAAGCSGGGAGSALSSLTPAAPVGAGGGSSSTASSGTSTISFTAEIPAADFQAATASSSRSVKYLSPGSTGISVLLGNGNAVAGAGLSGTAQLTGSVNETGGTTALAPTCGVVQTATISYLSASNTNQPSIGQTLVVTKVQNNVTNTAVGVQSAPFTITSTAANGTVLTGTFAPSCAGVLGGYTAAPYSGAATGNAFGNAAGGGFGPGYNFTAGDLVTFTQNTGGANGQTFILGNQQSGANLNPAGIPAPGVAIPSTVFGTTATSAINYSFSPSVTNGYYTLRVNIVNLKVATTYYLGVVLTDLNNKNYVLSEGQTNITTPAAGGTAVAAFTLNPVVNGAFLPAPAQVSPNPVGSATNPIALVVGIGNSLSTTVFAVDELGYIIPNQPGATLPDNNTATGLISITAGTAGQLTFQGYTAPAPAAGATSMTAPPFAGVLNIPAVPANTITVGGAGANLTNAFGTYFTGISSPTPNALGFGVTGGTNQAGNPINILCGTNSASVAWNYTLNSTTPTNAALSGLAGYPLTPGANYPVAAASASAVNLTPVNCSPGIGGVIN